MAVEASIWDLQGTSPYYKVFDKLNISPKKTVPIAEMTYPTSKNPKPVYFLLLKLYNMSDYGILSRNLYWSHLSGGDYKLLGPYRKKRIPLKITSKVFIRGSTHEIEMHVQNTSKKPSTENLTYVNNFVKRDIEGDFDMSSLDYHYLQSGNEEKPEIGLPGRLRSHFSRREDDYEPRISTVNGTDVGVAFFLHFSVHGMKTDRKEGEDTRILPVHYSDNYFSLVPGEVMPLKISFEVPHGVTPRVTLSGWNSHGSHTVH